MNKKWDAETVAEIYKLYSDQSIPVDFIADQFHTKRQNISKILKRYGYPTRPKGFQPNNNKGWPIEKAEEIYRLWFKRHSYERRAKRKGLEFTLTDEQYLTLVTGNCHYCGVPHTSETRRVNRKQVAMLTIDRIDSSQGYIFPNCVSACKLCNTIKMDMTYEQFIEKIRSIHKHLHLEGN